MRVATKNSKNTEMTNAGSGMEHLIVLEFFAFPVAKWLDEHVLCIARKLGQLSRMSTRRLQL